MNPSSEPLRLTDCLLPEWPVPAHVRCCVTTRAGGLSLPPFDRLNLGTHVGDDAEAVAHNRQRLQTLLGCRPTWLHQVHSADVVEATPAQVLTADASWTARPGVAALVMTADCLPVLFCDRAGTSVAAAHAGWRGLAGGVLENTLKALTFDPAETLVWLGPAIGPAAFEVGAEVREAFVAEHAEAASAFVPGAQPGKFMADIYQLARIRLAAQGVTAIYGGGLCTVSDPRFFSYRRAARTGRFASLIWLAN